MKNFKYYEVEELSDSALKLINGGSWIGYSLGYLVGTALRYSGAYGIATMSTDMAVYFAKK